MEVLKSARQVRDSLKILGIALAGVPIGWSENCTALLLPCSTQSTLMDNDVRLGIVLHDKQEAINLHPARFKVIKAGKRFGKTKLALYRLVKTAGRWPNEVSWYIAPSYTQAKKIAWYELSWMIPKNFVRRKIETDLLIELVNGHRIQLVGADNEDALRGPRLRHICMDEAAYIKEHVWPSIISGQLLGADTKSTADFISSPNRNGRNWFTDFHAQAAQKMNSGDPDWAAFFYTIHDNPTLNPEEIQKIKDQNTDDTWNREYLAQESEFAGRLYSEFDPVKHVGIPESSESRYLYRGIDWGIKHPTVCLWVEVDMENKMVYVVDEFFKSDFVIEESCEYINRITGNRQVEWTVIDPSTAKRNSQTKVTDMDEFRRCGVPVIPADNRSRGIDILKMFFKKNRILIHPKCKNTILQLKNLQRDDTEDDDCPDVLRYIILKLHDSIRGMNIRDEEVQKLAVLDPNREVPREISLNDPNIFKQEKKEQVDWLFAQIGGD